LRQTSSPETVTANLLVSVAAGTFASKPLLLFVILRVVAESVSKRVHKPRSRLKQSGDRSINAAIPASLVRPPRLRPLVIPSPIGFITAFFAALIVIKTFMRFISRFNFAPFGVYRVIVGALFLWIIA
jgi:hypothetical protein